MTLPFLVDKSPGYHVASHLVDAGYNAQNGMEIV